MESIPATEVICEKHSTPIRDTCDVLVVGGGAAGVMAALAAAHNGAKTILVEKNAFLGGDMLCGGILWKGFWGRREPSACDEVRLVQGLVDDLIVRLKQDEGTTGFYEERGSSDRGTVCLHADREILPLVLMDMLRDYGVRLYMRCVVADTIVAENAVMGIVMESKSGREAILSKCTIDCSGSGEIALRAGVPTHTHSERRRGGMAFGMANVDFKKALRFLKEQDAVHSVGYADVDGCKDEVAQLGLCLSKLPEMEPYMQKYHMDNELCMISDHKDQAGMIRGVSMAFDTTSVRETSQASMVLYDCCMQVGRLLGEWIPGFEDAHVDWTSPTVGIQYGRQVECDYDITVEDIAGNHIPDDTIGLFSAQGIAGRGWFGIPYKALCARGIDNLLVAGRALSSDEIVFTTTSKIGCCFLQGQGAGTGAALAIKHGCAVKALDIDLLQTALRKDGVFLG